MHVDAPIGLHRRGPECTQIGLAVGVEAHRDDLADMKAEGSRRCRRGHELVQPARIRRLTSIDGESVYPEVFATDTALAHSCLRCVRTGGDRGTVWTERLDVDPSCTRHRSDMGDSGNLSHDGRVVALPVADRGAGDRGRHDDLGRVGPFQQDRVGGLRSAGCR